MTRINLALPAALAAALALSACSMPDDVANNLTVSDVVANDEGAAIEGNFSGGNDLLADTAAPDNAAAPGNGQ